MLGHLRLVCAVLFVLAADVASAQGPTYLYDGRAIPLAYSDELVGVRRSAPPAGPPTTKQGHRLVEAAVVPSVTLLSLHPQAGQADVPVDRVRATREVLQDVLADPTVAWAYQALVHPPSGQRLLLTNEIVVKVRPGVTADAAAALLPAALTLVRPLSGADDELIVALTSPKTDDPLTLAHALAAAWWVEWAHPNFLREYTPAAVPDDPMFPEQWYLENAGQGGGAPGADAELVAAWEVTVGRPDVVIAVVDDGVLLSHPDLAPNLWTNPGEIPGAGVDGDGNGFVEDVHGWDFARAGNDPNPIGDRDSHGTAAAGVAAARGGDGAGVTGACPRCRILPVKIFHGSSYAGDATVAEALRYAARHADVVTNSWGGGTPSSAISSAIAFATTLGRGGKGAPVLFAAGNAASGYLPATLAGLTAFAIPAGRWIFEWEYLKDDAGRRGFDTAWLDNVAFPDGSVETFEACDGLPAGWETSGGAAWRIVDDPTRAASALGGRCAAKAGTIGDAESTALRTERTVPAGTLSFSVWVSADTFDGGDLYSTRCLDGVRFSLSTPAGDLVQRSPLICGNQSSQFRALQDGVLGFPASDPRAIAVGASTNFDGRADYSQWGSGLWMVAPSSGGSLRVTTTSGPLTAYTSAFGGTSSATALAAGIVGLLLSEAPDLTEDEVRERLRRGSRKIGGVAYDADGWSSLYGYGAVSARLVVGVPAVVPLPGSIPSRVKLRAPPP